MGKLRSKSVTLTLQSFLLHVDGPLDPCRFLEELKQILSLLIISICQILCRIVRAQNNAKGGCFLPGSKLKPGSSILQVKRVYVMVQFYPWFKYIFLCFILIVIYYQTQKQRKLTFKPWTKSSHNIYTQPTQLTQEMDSHANLVLGMIKVYFYIVVNFPSKHNKVCTKSGLPTLQRTYGEIQTPTTTQDGWLNIPWA